MDAVLKQKWCEALRSGAYSQGKSLLRNAENKFCCLGVLCDIVDKDRWKFDEVAQYYCFYYKGRELSENFTTAFANKVGIDVNTEDHLIYMNDAENKSFVEIADYVEQNL